jgi:hypothetical protein
MFNSVVIDEEMKLRRSLLFDPSQARNIILKLKHFDQFEFP